MQMMISEVTQILEELDAVGHAGPAIAGERESGRAAAARPSWIGPVEIARVRATAIHEGARRIS